MTTSLAFPGVVRLLAGVLPESEAVDGEAPLELTTNYMQPARVISANIIEGRELCARAVPGDPVVGFAAFLDGTQTSTVVRFLRGGIPIVVGTVAAVVRDRRDRRMFTWRHAVEKALYAPRAHMPDLVWQRLAELGAPLHDTSDVGDSLGLVMEHPLALREAAIHRVQKDRERVEQSLALGWCDREERTLLIDGGISGAESVARATCVVGVVKSHRTVYASGDALAITLALGHGERSSVFVVTSPKRTSVASWYLRLRDWRAGGGGGGRDPMWGLVRVESAMPDSSDDVALSRRADEVSRWILAEAMPVSLPDGRWDKMVYGVHDCEEFLRAIV